MVANLKLQANVPTMQVPQSNIRKERGSKYPGSFNVDIMYSIVGGTEPPILPLRGEFLTQGVEMVLDAAGVAEIVVSKEQKRREALLLEKLKVVESKLKMPGQV